MNHPIPMQCSVDLTLLWYTGLSNVTLLPGNPFLGQPYGWRSVSNRVNSCSIPEMDKDYDYDVMWATKICFPYLIKNDLTKPWLLISGSFHHRVTRFPGSSIFTVFVAWSWFFEHFAIYVVLCVNTYGWSLLVSYCTWTFRRGQSYSDRPWNIVTSNQRVIKSMPLFFLSLSPERIFIKSNWLKINISIAPFRLYTKKISLNKAFIDWKSFQHRLKESFWNRTKHTYLVGTATVIVPWWKLWKWNIFSPNQSDTKILELINKFRFHILPFGCFGTNPTVLVLLRSCSPVPSKHWSQRDTVGFFWTHRSRHRCTEPFGPAAAGSCTFDWNEMGMKRWSVTFGRKGKIYNRRRPGEHTFGVPQSPRPHLCRGWKKEILAHLVFIAGERHNIVGGRCNFEAFQQIGVGSTNSPRSRLILHRTRWKEIWIFFSEIPLDLSVVCL